MSQMQVHVPLPNAENALWRSIVLQLQRQIRELTEFQNVLTDIRTVVSSRAAPMSSASSQVNIKFFEGYVQHKPHFFSDFIPKMQTLALRLPELFPSPTELPILVPQVDAVVTLSQVIFRHPSLFSP